MAKVHPNMVPAPGAVVSSIGERADQSEAPTTLTVWRKSLLFDCKGFTVFDAKGNLAYRVDSYASENGNEVVLMDAAGRPAFTVRRKRFSFRQGEQWLVFAGEEARRPVYAVRRGGGKTLAHVTACGAGSGAPPSYVVEGSYARRCCVVYDAESRRAVAEVRPKEVVGTDVFWLVVQQPGVLGVSLAMALVVALEQMFARPSLLRSWSSSSII